MSRFDPLGKIRLRWRRSRAKAVRVRRPHAAHATRASRRARMRNFGVNRYRYLIAIPCLLGLIALAVWWRTPTRAQARFLPVEEAVVNPLRGWAVDAALAPETVEIEHSLVYAEMTWREIEPEEGVYDFEAFEDKNHFGQWRALGKRLILRFVLDAPGAEAHADIPDWLAGQMEYPGMAYDLPLGRGFSPNYSSVVLMDKHLRVLKELGARYGDDSFLACVELGSIGHDGLWMVDRTGSVDPLPLATETRQYIWHYTEAFPRTTLLVRRPYQEARLLSVGLYDPFLGAAEATWEWIDMLQYGGYDDQIDTYLRAMPRYFEQSLVGAHLADEGRALLRENQDALTRQIVETHASYVAGAPCQNLTEAERTAMAELGKTMGYRFWVRYAEWDASIRSGYRLRAKVALRNDGVAPMDGRWPLEMSLMRNGRVVCASVGEATASDLLTGETILDMDLDVPASLAAGDYTLALAILDPATNEPGVKLLMDAPQSNRRYHLGAVHVYR